MNMRLFFVFIVIFWGIFFKLGPYEERTVFFFSFPLPHSTYRRRSISYFNSNKKCMGMLPSVKQGHHVHHVCSLLWLFVLSRVYLGGRHSDQITHILLYSQNGRFSLFYSNSRLWTSNCNHSWKCQSTASLKINILKKYRLRKKSEKIFCLNFFPRSRNFSQSKPADFL